MCGIVGILGIRSEADVRSIVDRLVRAIRHRGPDGVGVSIVRQVDGAYLALGHARLSIIDLSEAGKQPMVEPHSGCQIVFNGEIYNYRELRVELQSYGHEFVGHSDTEVLLHGYMRWGEGVLERLSGMFAFAIWDGRDQSLFLARDHMGIKPLYFSSVDGIFIFASEVRALLKSGLVAASLDLEAVRQYLIFGAALAPRTILREVGSLLPGECLRVRGGSVTRRRYWDPVVSARNSAMQCSFDEAVEATRVALIASVRRHLVSDVPVAAFLSGGVDSSIVTAVAKRIPEGKNLETYSLIFPGTPNDEAAHIVKVARHLGIKNNTLALMAPEFLAGLDSARDSLDQPSLDGVNTFFISRLIRDHGIKVGLSGTGGDELFGGYPSFMRTRLAYRFEKTVPLAARRMFAAVIERGLSERPSLRKLAEYSRATGGIPEHCAISRRVFSVSEAAFLMCAQSDADWALPAHLVADLPEAPEYVENSVSLVELQLYMQNVLLRDIDSASMASGVEIRVPLLDKELVERVLSFPGWMKRAGATSKPLLVEACGDLIPRSFFQRRKMGFTIPIGNWIHTSLRSEVESTLLDAEAVSKAGLDGRAVQRVWESYSARSSTEGWARVWSLYSLIRWVRRWTTDDMGEGYGN